MTPFFIFVILTGTQWSGRILRLVDTTVWQDPSLSFIPTDGMYAENAGAIFCQDDSKTLKIYRFTLAY
jgi:hypothetical protein